MWRSEAPSSTAALSRSLTCTAPILSASRRYGFGPVAERGFLRIHVGQPAVAIGHFAVDDLEKRGLERLGDGSGLPGANFDFVDRSHRRHFGGGAHEEDLVGHVQRLARQ